MVFSVSWKMGLFCVLLYHFWTHFFETPLNCQVFHITFFCTIMYHSFFYFRPHLSFPPCNLICVGEELKYWLNLWMSYFPNTVSDTIKLPLFCFISLSLNYVVVFCQVPFPVTLKCYWFRNGCCLATWNFPVKKSYLSFFSRNNFSYSVSFFTSNLHENL